MPHLFERDNLIKTAVLIAAFYVMFVLLIIDANSVESITKELTSRVILLAAIFAGFYVVDNFAEKITTLSPRISVLAGGFLGSFAYIFFLAGFDTVVLIDVALKSAAYSFLALGIYSIVFKWRGEK